MKELTNECQEAWISLQHSNRVNDTLREDLCAKSLCVDSLGTIFLCAVGHLHTFLFCNLFTLVAKDTSLAFLFLLSSYCGGESTQRDERN